MSIINLTDHFSSPTGEFIGYLDASQVAVPTGKHLNIRSFHSDSITIPGSMINYRNTNVTALNGETMLTLNSPITFIGTNVPSLQMGQMDVMTMASLDSNRMINMEGVVSPGIESWSGTGVTITQDAGQGNINTIQVALTGGVSATATSTYVDDLSTNFQDFSDYVIALQLINFPSQTGTLAAPTGLADTPSSTGGTLAAGTYFYEVTALNSQGETTVSNEVNTGALTGTTNSVVLTWTAVTGATSYRIYRGNAGTGSENTYYTSATNSFTDTGAAGTAGTPPASNTAIVDHLDLANSFIDFTSDAGYAAGLTDTFSFSQSTNDLTAGGNVTFQIPRASLTHVTLSNIVGIRFRLLSVGNMTFEATNMSMYSPSALNNNYISIDTKRGWVYKNFGYQTTSGIYGAGNYGAGNYNVGGVVSVNSVTEMILPGSRPKNVTVVTKFMPGNTVPTSPSTITLYARQYGFPVNGVLTFDSAGSTLAINDINGNVYTSGTLAALSANQEYYLVFEAYEDQLRMSVWNGSATFYGSNIFNSGWQTTKAGVGRGYIGFEFNPANYDSYMKYFTVGDSEFARYQSKPFQRFTNAEGAAIAAITSEPINLVQGVYNNYGDGAYSTDFTKGAPLPPSLLVQRSGAQWSGGLITNALFLANPIYLSISGDIYPVPTGSTINGDYRIVFQNDLKQIGYVATLQNILPNQWNHFEIPFNGQLAADNYQVIFEQTGFFADSFYLDNFALNYLTFAWEVSPDNGVTFYPFLTAINDQWSGVNFTGNVGKSLVVRGIALTDQSWVQSYELAPH